MYRGIDEQICPAQQWTWALFCSMAYYLLHTLLKIFLTPSWYFPPYPSYTNTLKWLQLHKHTNCSLGQVSETFGTCYTHQKNGITLIGVAVKIKNINLWKAHNIYLAYSKGIVHIICFCDCCNTDDHIFPQIHGFMHSLIPKTLLCPPGKSVFIFLREALP